MKIQFKRKTQYDHIKSHMIGKTVFEIGVNEKSLLHTKVGHKFLSSNCEYLGLDITDRETSVLPFVKGDIVTYQFQKKYDTILMIEVLEHIHFREWKNVLDKLMDNLNKGGYLILSTPYKEKLSNHIKSANTDYYQFHTIFGITPYVFRRLLPNCKIKILRRLNWKHKGESHIWAFGRFVKRLIIRNYPVICSNILVIWEKV